MTIPPASVVLMKPSRFFIRTFPGWSSRTAYHTIADQTTALVKRARIERPLKNRLSRRLHM